MKLPLALLALSGFGSIVAFAAGPFQANGLKIGEVGVERAIVWTRLTAVDAWENAPGAALLGTGGLKEGSAELSAAVAAWRVPGASGEVRLSWWPEAEPKARKSTEWAAVVPGDDFTRQIELTGLQAGTRYEILSEARSAGGDGAVTSMVQGTFRTAPAAESPDEVLFTVVTGQDYHNRDNPDMGHAIYPVMAGLDPGFFVHTGDIVYYDKAGPEARSMDLARLKWQRMYALPFQRAFHNRVASYFIKDDHDSLDNDCWPGQRYGQVTWEQGLKIFREQVPMGERTWRTARWGKDLQIWLMEGRDFRSPNNLADGPEKTIWGREQLEWMEKSVAESDATFRILISPTPIVGPDRANKNDNHANKGFTHEGDRIRRFVGHQPNMFIVCGDRHWQYVSEDPRSGAREYSCGPTTDKHAGGFSEKDRSEMHRYLRVRGGFLSVMIRREDGRPQAVFRHHAVDGSVCNEEVQVAR